MCQPHSGDTAVLSKDMDFEESALINITMKYELKKGKVMLNQQKLVHINQPHL